LEKFAMNPESCKSLWREVLAKAAEDFTSGDRSLKEDAQMWFFSKSEMLGSFFWVCENLEIEPVQFQEILKEIASTKKRKASFSQKMSSLIADSPFEPLLSHTFTRPG